MTRTVYKPSARVAAKGTLESAESGKGDRTKRTHRSICQTNRHASEHRLVQWSSLKLKQPPYAEQGNSQTG